MRVVVCVVLVSLLAPAAAAAPLDLWYSTGEGVVVSGAAVASASEGGLDLAGDARRGVPVALSWSSASGYFLTARSDYVGSPDVFQNRAPPENESVRWGPGRLALFGCPSERCHALLLVDGAGSVRIAGEAGGALGFAEVERRYLAGFSSTFSAPTRRDAFEYAVPQGWARVGGVDADALPLEDARAGAEGRVVLFLDGPAGVVEREGRRSDFWTGNASEPRTVAGVTATPMHVRRFLVLELRDARLETAAGTRAALFAPALDLRVEGGFVAEGADGVLRVAERRVELEGARVEMEGAFHARAARQDAGLSLLRAPGAHAGEAAGDAAWVRVDGEAVTWRSEYREVAQVGVAAAVVLALLLVLVKAAWVAYWRIEPSDVLANPRRAAVYEQVRRHAGASLVEIARGAGIAVSAAAYHVRVLEARGFVVTLRWGRVTTVRAGERVVPLEELNAKRLLDASLRREIARHVADAPLGLTQSELCARTGRSQRLISHHLRALCDASLVRATEGRPARYVAEGALGPALLEASAEAVAPDAQREPSAG